GLIRADLRTGMSSWRGLGATRLRLVAAERSPGSNLPEANRRPGRVASMMPTMAATMARMASSLLLDGSLNALPSSLPDQVKKTTIKTRWTTAPTRLFTPTAATSALVSTPDFCRYRTFSAMPPTLAGETRLTNDDAAWASTVGQNRIRGRTAPINATALARYVAADMTMISGSHVHSADWTARQPLRTCASWGSRK